MSSLCSELATGITAWLAASSHRSLSMLARLSCVPYATVRRIAQTEVDMPSPEVSIAICDLIFTREKTCELISRYYPAIGRLLVDQSLLYPPPADDSLREYLHSEKHLPLILLANTTTGIDLDDLVERFGVDVKEQIEELVDAGILRLKEGRLTAGKNFGTANLELTRLASRTLIGLCRKKTDAIADASQAYLSIEGLNAEAVKSLGKITEEFRQKVFSVISNSKNHGELIWFGSVVTNVLKHEELL